MVAPKNPSKDRVAPSAADTSRLQSADETAQQLDAFDAELAELKARHDQYFLGLERTEPIKERERIRKRLDALRTSHIRNAGLKFRVQGLWQKYLSYERMWLRVAREIEDGTYHRHLAKARRRSGKQEAPVVAAEKPKREELALEDDFAIDEGDPALAAAVASAESRARQPKTDPELPAAQPARPPPPPASRAAARPPPPPAAARRADSFPELTMPTPLSPQRPSESGASSPGARPPPPPPPAGVRGSSAPPRTVAGALPDDKMRAIYNAYVSAKRQCRESTDGITFDSVAKTINTQTPALMKAHNAKAVDYKVVIKNGKAQLKAVPRT